MLLHSVHHEPMLRRRIGGLTASAALHAAAFGLASMPARLLEPDAGASGDAQVVIVESAPRPLVAADPAAPVTPVTESRPPLEVAGAEIDLDKLRARRDQLFPFLTLDVPGMTARTDRDRTAHGLRNPFGPAAIGSSLPPLLLSDRELQQIVDRAWSRRERWRPFLPIGGLLDTHNPDNGRAADVVKAYIDQNLLQPYYDANVRDGRYWTMLGLAADHLEFIDMVRRHVRDNPSTRVTTELLFLLEELAQGSRDTLLMLTSTVPEAALRQTASAHPEAFAFAGSVRAHYLDRLRAARIEAPAAISARYDQVRLSLLTTIVERSPRGYRTADARYLAGVILVEQNDLNGAERWWRDLHPVAGDLYAPAIAEVARIMRLPRGRRAAAIAGLLGAEHRRWLDFSEQRLRRFGHTAESY